MYKYNPCPQTTYNGRTMPYCKPVVGRGSAIPESTRVLAETCSTTYVLGQPVVNQPTLVPVQTTPASSTTAAAARAVQQQESDPYNPATRFSQYFPAEPLPYIEPRTMRVPSNEPLPPVVVCVPNNRYESTAETLARLAKQ